MREDHVILVRHIPRQLRDDQIEDLFASLGAAGVRTLNSKLKRTALAFVTFRTLAQAQCAVTRLHQMDVMGYRLSAELSNQRNQPMAQEPRGKCALRDKADQYLSLLKALHLDKCPPHRLKYLYPKPTLHVLLNILSALCEHRKFYTQVLHLMNKMNLACPFDPAYRRSGKIDQLFLRGQKWTASHLAQNLEDLEVMDDPTPDELTAARGQTDPMEASDTEEEVESEMEDSSDDVTTLPAQDAAILNLKRARERKRARGVKRPKFIRPMVSAPDRPSRGDKRKRQEKVFEPVSSTAAQRRKLIQVNVSADLTSISTSSSLDQHDTHSSPTIIPDRGNTVRTDCTVLPPIQTGLQKVSEIDVSKPAQGKDFGEVSTDMSSHNASETCKTSSPSSRLSLPSTSHPRPESSEHILPAGPSHPRPESSEHILPAGPSHPRPESSEHILPAGPSHPSAESSEHILPAGPSHPAFAGLGSAADASRAADHPQKPDVCATERQEVKRGVGVISKERLDCNRLSERDRGFVKAFNNYSAGSPCCRLYVKNLAKSVSQEDVEFVFRRYYLPEYKEQGTMFDVRLMQEGRMKGQAFITLQTVQQASLALQETNGFILRDKPMVVQYARSSQAKPAPTS